MALLEHHLGRRVAERARHGGEDFVLGAEGFGDAEVGQDQVGLLCLGEVQEVLGLEVWWGLDGRSGAGGKLLTAMDDIVLVQVVDGVEDLLERLGGILLGELAALADAVEQLAAGRQLGDDVELVLDTGRCISLRLPPVSPRVLRKDGSLPWTRTSRQT